LGRAGRRRGWGRGEECRFDCKTQASVPGTWLVWLTNIVAPERAHDFRVQQKIPQARFRGFVTPAPPPAGGGVFFFCFSSPARCPCNARLAMMVAKVVRLCNLGHDQAALFRVISIDNAHRVRARYKIQGYTCRRRLR